VGDEIDLEEPRLSLVPLGEGADGDLVLEPGAGPRRRHAPDGPGRAGGGEQAPQGGGAGLAEQLVDGGRQDQFAVLGEAVEQVGHEGLEARGTDVPGGLPQDLGGGRHGRSVHARAPGPRAGGAGAQWPAEQADGGLAVEPGHGHDLVQQAVLLPPAGAPVALALRPGVFPKSGSRHGGPPGTGVG
jgi:hypothetical protein